MGTPWGVEGTCALDGTDRLAPPHRRDCPSFAIYGSWMLVAVFGDSHAHAEALDAVLAASDACGAEQLWSLGDMVGGGPDAGHVVSRTRERCRVALVGNHDYGV